MRELPSQGERFLTALLRLVWIPEHPERLRGIGQAAHPRVIPIQRSQGVVVLGIVQGGPLFRMQPSWRKLAEIEQAYRQGIVRYQQSSGIVASQGQALLAELPRGL